MNRNKIILIGCNLLLAVASAYSQSVGIGTNTPDPYTKLNVIGTSSIMGIRATTGTPSFSFTLSPGVYGESLNSPGVIGVSQTQNGVLGASAGGNYAGVAGTTSSPTGYGVWGSVSDAGIAGYFDGGSTGRAMIAPRGAVGIGTPAPNGRLVVLQTGTTGIDTAAAIYGYSNSAGGSIKGGVFGTYNSANNYGTGVQGLGYQGVLLSNASSSFPEITNSSDMGVYGSGATSGVLGTSTGGYGVKGVSLTTGGVVGFSQASVTGGVAGIGNTIGVFGNAKNVGNATVPSIRYGIYGMASGAATNLAGYFSGNVTVTGTIAKGSGTFKIDHPLDPENKYLYHSFVESPDMMNIYNGNIVTDDDKKAKVILPDYFDALNKDFRYQLTVIGTFAQAIISRELEGNSFIIESSVPNVKVSWQVTGVRKDKYAEAHRVIPEVEKEAANKGRYVHAAEWKQPISKEINYEINYGQETETVKEKK